MDRRSTWKNLDWLMIGIYAALVCSGWLSVYAAGYDFTNTLGTFFNHVYGKQLIWIGISALFAMAILITDNKFYTAFAYILYALIILLLIAAIAMGGVVKGSKSWINLGGFQFQPAEFAKFATSLALAKYLSALNINLKQAKTWIVAIILFMVPMLIIILQNETGSALVFAVFFLVIYRFGFPGIFLLIGLFTALLGILALLFDKYYIIITLGVIAAFATYLVRRERVAIIITSLVFVLSAGFVFATDYIFMNVLESHQKQRIDVYLGREVTVKDADYNVRQSKIAIGSGGFSGKGFLQGTLTKFNFVPEQTSDFIFCTIGEEYGFIGSSVLLLMFLGLMLRILFVAERQRSRFSKIYAYAVACIIFFHILVNIGMTIGLVPVIGIPLPYISYGGSSMLAFTILLFILIKLDADRLSVLR
jgi:rod shape determining protein RodA